MKVSKYVYIRKENPWFLDSNVEIKKHMVSIDSLGLDEFIDTNSNGYHKELFQHNYFIYHVEIGDVTISLPFQSYWTPDDLENILLSQIDKILINRSVACIYIDSKSKLLSKLARLMIDCNGKTEMVTEIIDEDKLVELLFKSKAESL